MKKRRILFLGETYRADAITWINGLKEFGDFEVVTWELKTNSNGIYRIKRIFELLQNIFFIKNICKKYEANMVIAERTTSYGFLAALSGVKPKAIAQQGITDLWPTDSLLFPFKKIVQNYAFKKADLIHAWGPVMAIHMQKSKVDMKKVLTLPKGINLNQFYFDDNNATQTIKAIVTRSLQPEYQHEVILKAFSILKKKKINFELTIIGDGILLNNLQKLSKKLDLENEVVFLGRIDNNKLPDYLAKSNLYLSMPTTEGVSASLFEAMAAGCFPIVSDVAGNQSWITNRKNGILVPVYNFEKLASEIEWIFKSNDIKQKAIADNRNFVEKNANYATNMKIISEKYHELISLNQS
jgi:glycosyltransferase involved in cell wall biosynthesis